MSSSRARSALSAAGRAALDEMRWAVDAGFKGFGELSPHSQHLSVNDPSWRAVLALAGELNLPVNLYLVPGKYGVRFGVSMGWNGKSRYEMRE